jgi:hypothetical protein
LIQRVHGGIRIITGRIPELARRVLHHACRDLLPPAERVQVLKVLNCKILKQKPTNLRSS